MSSGELAVLGGKPLVTSKLPPTWPRYQTETVESVARMISAGDVYAFGDHQVLEDLESWARGYFGSPFALATSSGTAALESAYVGLGLKPGDEVLVPSYTFHATASPLFAIGALPVLCDCLPEDTRIDPADVAARITPRTRAIVATHMFGLPCDMSELRVLASWHDLALVEDAAQSHGARYRGAVTGAIGDAGCLSLGGAKMVSGGMGGLLLTASEDVYHAALVLGHAHERVLDRIPASSAYRGTGEVGWGRNLRMSPLCAKLALEHATSLDQRIALRTDILEGLTARLRRFPFLEPPLTPCDRTRGGWYGYKAQYNAAALDGLPLDDFLTIAQGEGVRIGRPTTRPLHMTAPFKRHDIGLPGYDIEERRPVYNAEDLPRAKSLWERAVSFPDKRLHEKADDVLDEYEEAFAKIEENVEKYGVKWISAKLGVEA